MEVLQQGIILCILILLVTEEGYQYSLSESDIQYLVESQNNLRRDAGASNMEKLVGVYVGLFISFSLPWGEIQT